MKHMSHEKAAAKSPAKPAGRRALAKQQTREKVLAAARRQFTEAGYEGATIRDIAATAGTSTGAVFANFEDKAEVFREIVFTDMDALLALQREAASRSARVEEALLNALMAGYAFYKDRLPLAQAAFSVTWSLEDGRTLRDHATMVRRMAFLQGVLEDGVERGELAPDADIGLLAQMILNTYLSNFVLVIFHGWTVDALEARSRDQIRILLAGARRS